MKENTGRRRERQETMRYGIRDPDEKPRDETRSLTTKETRSGSSDGQKKMEKYSRSEATEGIRQKVTTAPKSTKKSLKERSQ